MPPLACPGRDNNFAKVNKQLSDLSGSRSRRSIAGNHALLEAVQAIRVRGGDVRRIMVLPVVHTRAVVLSWFDLDCKLLSK